MNSFKLFYSLFFDQVSSRRFVIGVWIGLAFSIAIILSTIGIMDGFEKALREGLKLSSGEITIQSQAGFYGMNGDILKVLEENPIRNFSQTIQTESFLITEEEAKGVVVRGIDDTFGEVVGLNLNLRDDQVIIGSELAKLYQIKKGDEVVLAFAKGANEFKNMPSLHRFLVHDIVEHGVYQKDLRTVYVHLNQVQDIIGVGDKINLLVLNTTKAAARTDEHKHIENVIRYLKGQLEGDFIIRPYWREFSSLIEAAQAEKFMISIILQLIVVISVFNVLAFIYFINETKSKELFLFKALGFSKKAISNIWMKFVLLMWIAACLLAMVMVAIFKILLLKLPFLQLPAEIYQLPRLEMIISIEEYLIVFALALVWILIITFFFMRKMKKTSLLEGLRQEFA